MGVCCFFINFLRVVIKVNLRPKSIIIQTLMKPVLEADTKELIQILLTFDIKT